MSAPASPGAGAWIGVSEVAAELDVGPRKAFELVRRLGIPLLAMAGGRMDEVRFTRADWAAARDRAKQPLAARQPYRTSFTTPPQPPPPSRPAGPTIEEMIDALRRA